MKKFILTSVALFAEFGDLDSMDDPSICTNAFDTEEKAHGKMLEELETEINEAKAAGYDSFKSESYSRTATFENGEKGSGCSWNLVRWEITEIEF